MPGLLRIGWIRDSLTASLAVGEHESPVRPGARRGNELVLESTSPALHVRYDLKFRGDSVSGVFTYNGQSGLVNGRRITGRQ